MATERYNHLRRLRHRMKRDDLPWGVDALTTEVMQARWRRDALCALIETYDRCGKRERETLCAACPVAEPCFWAALIEERAFRWGTIDPPGARGGVDGAKRRFILRELTDGEIMKRYRAEVERNTAERISGVGCPQKIVATSQPSASQPLTHPTQHNLTPPGTNHPFLSPPPEG
jgi:hypothetical protein